MALNGSLSQPNSLIGQLSSPKSLSGMVSNVARLSGKLSNATLRGYSAYDLAVLAGYEGTEEEWLESLQGERMEMRNNNGILEYRYSSDETWNTLVDLNAIIGDYEMLINRPQIDGIVLSGNRDLSDSYLRNDEAISNLEIEELLTF